MTLIVTLSSIPPRFGHLGPTLRSLLEQREPIQEVQIWLPRRYRRFPNWDGQLPEVPRGVVIHRCDEDLGPATKILPAVRAFAGQEVDLLYCDDDRLFDPGWAARFAVERVKRPGTAIAEAGWDILDISRIARSPERLPRMGKGRDEPGYRLKRRLSLGLWSPPRFARSGYVDVAGGYGGVLVRPDFLGPNAFDVPPELRVVDDPWLSGCLEANGVPIWLNAAGSLAREQRAGRIDALLRLRESGTGRRQANAACVAWHRQHHGIWSAASGDAPST